MALVLPAAAGALDGSISIGLVDTPSQPSDPRSRQYVVDVVEPGESVTRTVRVTNGTDAPLDLSVDVSGAVVEGGSFRLDERADAHVPAWAHVAPSDIAIAAHDAAAAEVTFAVPDDAPLGEHYGVVWALPRDPVGGVVNRVGVRVYLLVDDDGVAHSDVRIERFTPRRTPAGDAEVVFDLANTGQRAVEPRGELSLAGGPRVPVAGGPTIAPGERGEVVVPVGDVDDGPWRATLRVTANEVERAATASVRFPGAGETGAPVRARPARLDDRTHDDRVRTAVVAAAIAAIAAVTIAAARMRAWT